MSALNPKVLEHRAQEEQRRAMLRARWAEEEARAEAAAAMDWSEVEEEGTEDDGAPRIGGPKGGQTRAYERLYDVPPPACRWRMGRLIWQPCGLQTVLLRCHGVAEIHNGSRPTPCARVSVLPMDDHLDPRRRRDRRIEAWVGAARLAVQVEPYRRWTPLRLTATGRGAWKVQEVPPGAKGLWIACTLLDREDGLEQGLEVDDAA
ncbi:hypothetical protein ABZW02_20325 [Streptomyces sp. NPDC005180]|uniref:hypothetical protein n=1 Tax=Streptomyces sp. NPDC005180 TaxID=3156868 RepID=UPI0033A7EE9F